MISGPVLSSSSFSGFCDAPGRQPSVAPSALLLTSVLCQFQPRTHPKTVRRIKCSVRRKFSVVSSWCMKARLSREGRSRGPAPHAPSAVGSGRVGNFETVIWPAGGRLIVLRGERRDERIHQRGVPVDGDLVVVIIARDVLPIERWVDVGGAAFVRALAVGSTDQQPWPRFAGTV